MIMVDNVIRCYEYEYGVVARAAVPMDPIRHITGSGDRNSYLLAGHLYK